ncbi:MAG: hypothetical protein WC340_09795 [Kiritimatiellia bacterium]
MKCITTICAIAVFVFTCTGIRADGVQLKRSQWLKKIGASVMDEGVLKETFSQVAEDEKVEFVQRAMTAVSRMPVEPERKAAAFVRTAVSCIQASKGDTRFHVIAEVFATVPVSFLPVVTEELSKRFNQEFNNLSDEAYEEISTSVVKIAAKRNERADDAAVRNTFVVLAFLRGATNKALEDKLLALMPDDRTNRLVDGWLPAALNGDYTSLLAAADVEPLTIRAEFYGRLVGLPNMGQRLFLMSSGSSLEQVFTESWVVPATRFEFNQPSDVGVLRIPKGYQNQTF